MADPHTSAPAERLLRRRTDPIGVVDVRPIVQRYERATAWPRQHIAVLDRSMARTSLDERPEQRPPTPLVTAGPAEGVRNRLDMVSASAPEDVWRAPSAAPVSVMHRLRQARESSAPGGRDRGDAAAERTAAPRAAAPQATPSSTAVIGPAMHAVSRFALDRRSASTFVPPDDASGIPRGPAQTPRGEPREAVGSTVRADGLPLSPVVREATTPLASAAFDSIPPAHTRVWAARAASARTPDAASMASASTSMAPTPAQPLVQRRTGTRGTTPVSAPHDTGLPTQTSRASGDPFEMHPARDGTLEGVRHSVPEAAPARSPESGVDTSDNGMLLASTAGARVARVAAPTLPSAGAVGIVPTAPFIDRVSPRADMRAGAAVAAAEPVTGVPNSSARPRAQMVWRRGPSHDADVVSARSAAAPAASTWSSVPDGVRLEQPAAGPFDRPAGAIAPAAGMTPAARQSGPGVNIEQLAQEVMRRIVEQAAIERERIGEPWR